MDELHKDYQTQLDSIAENIQNSPLLEAYLDTEEVDEFKALVQAFEPAIGELHASVANNHPLQLISFEKELLDAKYEGMYLPRILGYCVLRGELSDRYKYIKPQDHFKDVLLSICNSSNFEVIKHRIGQTLQIGFSLSSDIWSTNLINEIPLKSVRYFLESKKLEKYRNIDVRKSSYLKFQRQYKSLNFMTAEFPSDPIEMKTLTPRLKTFILLRANGEFNNDNLVPHLVEFLKNDNLRSTKEYLELLMIIGMTFDLSTPQLKVVREALEDVKGNFDNFEGLYFEVLDRLYDIPEIHVANADKRFSTVVDKKGKGDLTKYYEVVDEIHSKGYIHEDAIEAVRAFYDQHQGLSDVNECVRKVIFSYFANFLINLPPTEYSSWFEIMKTMVIYMGIFSNQKFNLGIKEYSLKYIKKLIKTYTDKRGRDYQDIKKYVKTSFVDLNFLTAKQIVELFKTKRKKPVEKA